MTGMQNLDRLLTGVASGSFGECLVVLSFEVGPEVVLRILAIPSVVGVILSSEAEKKHFAGNSHVGYRYGEFGSKWVFPRALAHRVVFLGRRESIGLRICAAALRRGVICFTFIEPTTGMMSPRS